MNSWNSRCPGLGSVVPSTLLALWSGRWPRIQTSAEGARTPALKIVQPFLSSDMIWYLKLSKYHQISFVCTDAPLLQFQDSKPVGIAFKSTKCHKQGYLYGSRHLSPSSFKIYFTILHHTSTEIWNWELGSLGFVALRADSSYQTRGIVLRHYALPWHGALSSPGAWFPASRDRATKPRSSALARLHLRSSGVFISGWEIHEIDLQWI